MAGGPDTHLQVDGVALSGMMYAWGQFIDHDMDLQRTGTEDISVVVPPGDEFLEAGTTIPITRVGIDPATGVAGSPATAVNTVTGWLDGSQVYGSDAATAASLRTTDGHMAMSEGDNLPIVMTEHGPAFAAGDDRAQEIRTSRRSRSFSCASTTIRSIACTRNTRTGADQLYETAKAITTAEMVNITYNEFLPHLLGPDAIPDYSGYDPNVDPTITAEFAGAAFRFGHSLVSSDIDAMNDLGANTSAQGLAETFFEFAETFVAHGGADGILRNLASDSANELDEHIIDDLRNLLNDPPVSIDLAAINIQRAHDLGLGSLNQTREALGLDPYTTFDQVSSNPETAAALERAYGDVNAIDLWTGGLSEDHLDGAAIGSTFGRILSDQFEALRDGDRLYFENQGFDPQTLNDISSTTLADIIERNTDTTAMQTDAFVSTERHSGTLGGVDPTGAEAVEGQAQLVIGSPGNDTLTGGPMDDTLVAASGNQTMTGGGGADTFVMNGLNFDNMGSGQNTATITDFDPLVDTLQYTGEVNVHRSSDHHGGTLLHFGSETINLPGVSPQEALLINGGTVDPLRHDHRHDHHDDLLF